MAREIGDLEDMLFFPYNSIEVAGFDDRLYDSQDWSDYFRQFIGNGVFPNPSNGLKVESLNNSLVLTVRVGAAFANGRLYMQRKDFVFSVTPAHLTLGRRDIVVCRHDAINRTMQVLYIEGTAASVPIVPPIIRTDDIFDLKLCEITVNPNAQTITQANILDTRLNSAVCGIVHGLVDQVDTTDIFNQYQTFLGEQIEKWNQIQSEEQTNWRNQTDQQQADHEQHMRELAGISDEMILLLRGLETQSFTLINNNFDDWSVRRGCDIETFKTETGAIQTITIVALDYLLAEKVIDRIPNGVVETVTFYPFEMDENGNIIQTTATTMSKTTERTERGAIERVR